MIEVLSRSGLAKNAQWTSGNGKVRTPNLLVLSSISSPHPDFSQLIIDEEHVTVRSPADPDFQAIDLPVGIYVPWSAGSRQEREDSCGTIEVEGAAVVPDVQWLTSDLAIIPNAFEMRRDARTFVRIVARLRKQVGYSKLLYAPGIMDVSNLALLTYLGIDLFDTSLIDYQSSRGVIAKVEGAFTPANAKWALPSGKSILDLNLNNAWQELQLVRHMIEIGRLRELVETRVHATPWNVAALRILDELFYDHQEAYTPVVGPRFYANAKQSLSRPDVVRHRRRIIERYRPSAHKKVLLLIPCSARKPYFLSKSHQTFRNVLSSVPNSTVIQELIITSPLGVVPRELELFYPAAQYDIPVTGHWDLDEQAMVQELVAHVASLGFERVISHLGGEGDIVKDAVECVDTSQGSPTSRDALAKLQETLTEACSKQTRTPFPVERAASMASVARFQFGEGGEALLEGCSVSGNYPYSRISNGNKQMGLLTPERGMISLTLDGAERLASKGLNLVEIEDFDLTGNLFAKGVKKADPAIRIGDEAIIIRNGVVEGVGIANMSAAEMTVSERGEAVRVRHKRKRA
jgi:archaeosine synthase alpha-subunit